MYAHMQTADRNLNTQTHRQIDIKCKIETSRDTCKGKHMQTDKYNKKRICGNIKPLKLCFSREEA